MSARPFDEDASDTLDAVLRDGVRDGDAPCAVGAVFARTSTGDRIYSGAAGTLFDDVTRRNDEGAVATADTVFDLASLTKVLATTLLAADAVATNRLSLDDTPFAHWDGVTVADLLAHESGLEAHREFFRPAVATGDAGRAFVRNQILRDVLAVRPRAPRGTSTVYSDLGFIALGALLENKLGARLDQLFDDVAARVFGPTGLRYVSIPDVGMHVAGPRVAPTEQCPWRGRAVQGQVHDDNAFAMGGVAGHAGLFGTAHDVLAAGRAFLDLATTSTTPLAETLKRFLAGTGATHAGARPLGFDRATPEGTTGGALSSRAFGHLGFTGTSLWIDPSEGGAVYVLLTNRVHPSRDREGIRALRIAFHQAARSLVDSAA